MSCSMHSELLRPLLFMLGSEHLKTSCSRDGMILLVLKANYSQQKSKMLSHRYDQYVSVKVQANGTLKGLSNAIHIAS